VLSEVASGNLANDCSILDGDYSDDEEEDLSDTDNEEEWDSQPFQC